MWQEVALHFAAGHPCAAGHFPSDPIIPGALILDAVVAAIAGTVEVVGVRAAKFRHPVRPGESLALRWRAAGAGAMAFECALPDRRLAVSGVLELAAVPA